MKNKFTKILSIGLVFAVLASLLVISTPASAGSEVFSLDSSLATITGKLAAGTDVYDIAVASNGSTAYAVVSDNTVWKTTDGGNNWAKTKFAGGAATKVAVAPDAADFVTVVADGSELWVSTSGGEIWGQTSGFTVNTINSVAVGPTQGSNHVAAVGLANGETWFFGPNVGDVFGGFYWKNVTTGGNVTAGAVLAVKFSPSYSTDFTLVTVSADNADARLNVYNTTFAKWNADYLLYGATSGGVVLDTGTATMTNVTSADIALPSSYYGFDAARIAYVSLNNYGIFRNSTSIYSTAPVYSIALNAGADKLVAGLVTGTTVYTASSPSGSSVTFAGSSPLKSPGGTGNVVADFLGTSVGAATSGPNSAFALSSSGSTFNDVAFIDTTANYADFAVNSDASKFYLVTNDGVNTSLWSKTTTWQRVFKQTGINWIVRPALSNFDVVFFAQKNTQTIYYSNDAGQTTWTPRVGPGGTIGDIAAQDQSILYAVDPAGVLYKATDSGIFWTPSLTNVGANGSLNLLSAGNLVAAGKTGIAYTSDSGATYTTTGLGFTDAQYAIADKLAAGGIITAASATEVKQFTIGTSTMFSVAKVTTAGISGLAANAGVTYAMAGTNMYRSPITNTAWTPITSSVSLAGLKVASSKLYSMSSSAIYVYSEVLAAAGPVVSAPADKYTDPINMETGNANNVVFQWTAVADTAALGVKYHLQIALDSAFAQVVKNVENIGSVLVIVGPTGDQTLGYDFPFQADTTYYWRVRVMSPVDSPWSATPRSFKIDTLAPVNVISPAIGANNVSTTPTFAWSAAAGATGYEIVVSDDPTFAIITFSRTTTQPVFATDDEQLAYSTVYYWRVRPTGAQYPAAGTAYKVGVFTTEARPADTTSAPPITITQTTQTITVTVPPPQDVIPPYILWIIIGIGAILVIALIVLIVRTRRVS